MTPLASHLDLSDPVDMAKRCSKMTYSRRNTFSTPLGEALLPTKDQSCDAALWAIGKILTEHRHVICELSKGLNAVSLDMNTLSTRVEVVEQTFLQRIKSTESELESLELRLGKMQSLFDERITDLQTHFNPRLTSLEVEASEWVTTADQLQVTLNETLEKQTLEREVRQQKNLQKMANLESKINAITDENLQLKKDLQQTMADNGKLREKMAKLEMKSLKNSDHHTERVTNLESFMYSIHYRQQEMQYLLEQDESTQNDL